MNFSWLTVFVGVFLLCTDAVAQSNANELNVMSFNIRYGTANDGDNHWDRRRQTVAQVIKDEQPDIVGTQETIKFQAEYLQQQLSDYTYFGRSRQADAESGEQCGILIRKNRFQRLAGGHFWLSKNPTTPGSKSWDSSLPRMATWLQLWDKSAGRSIYVINTHFDHRGQTARRESAKLIRQFTSNLPFDPKYVIVTGDFNARESSEPYNVLFDKQSNDSRKLLDTFRVHHANRTKTEGTFGGFKGTVDGARIDWIACSASFVVANATIMTKAYHGRYPSDHYPVTAKLKYRSDD